MMKPMDIQVETITPETAKFYMTMNKGNRSLSQRTIAEYSRQMKAGKWHLTHQGVAFDEAGELLDGQHRLRAIIDSGVSVQMVVTRNMPRSTFMVLDSGQKKQARQLLDGELKHRTSIASAARYLLVVEGKAGVGSQTNYIVDSCYWTSATTSDILECVERWPELQEAARLASSIYTNSRITKAPHTAVIAQIMRTPFANRLPDWANGLEYGAGLQLGDPRLALRDKFLRLSSSREHEGIGKTLAYSVIVKSWNAFATNKQLKVARMGRSEAVPMVVGFSLGT